MVEDPIDSISEVVYEWILDGDQDVIPDSDSGQEDKSMEKLKLALNPLEEIVIPFFIKFKTLNQFSFFEFWLSINLPVAESPPNL